MRFHVGAIPESLDFHPETDGWNSLREPSPLLFQLWAMPVAVLNMVVLQALWKLLVPPFQATGGPWVGIGLLLVLLFFIPVHEVIHALAVPSGISEKTIIGAWPQKLLFYAHYDGAMPRNRFLLVFVAPFMVLSVLPVFVAAFIARLLSDGTLPFILHVLVFLNGLAACGDVLAMGMIWKQVPKKALMRNQGWKTYWKLPEKNGASE